MQAKTVVMVIAEFNGRYDFNYGLMSAAGILASLPPIALALIFGDRLVAGLTAGGVKG
jgi:multiple sugar transport system permease protein